jgi:hypothetical protein
MTISSPARRCRFRSKDKIFVNRGNCTSAGTNTTCALAEATGDKKKIIARQMAAELCEIVGTLELSIVRYNA